MLKRWTFPGNGYRSLLPVVLIILAAGCVDQLLIDTGISEYPIDIDGHISDQPGPYLIKVTTSYDIQSRAALRLPLSVKKMTLFDNTGVSETLNESASKGYYYTGSIRGIVGRIYTLHVELLDGRIFESLPDTLYASGTVDAINFEFTTDPAQFIPGLGSTRYAFDIFFDASTGDNHNLYLWKFIGTYKVILTCCTCWVPITNDPPLVSDGQLVSGGHFRHIKAIHLPVNGYTFMYKVHAQVDQQSLSRQAFEFWKALRSQELASGSLFQPVSGRVPNNFVQLSGRTTDQPGMVGLFYATSVNSRSVWITRQDFPNPNLILPLELAPNSKLSRCIDAFPNSTSVRPSYWTD